MYLCARCTGIGLGLVAGLAYINNLANAFATYPFLIVVFAFPAILDWVFQVFGKPSTNQRRILTGYLVGNGYLVGLIALAKGWYALLFDYLIVFAAIAGLLYVIFRVTGIMDDYLAESWPLG